MKAPQLRILDEHFELLGEIDRYRELYFTRALVEPGDFAFMVPFDEEMAGLLQEDTFLLLDPAGTRIGVIEETEYATYARGTTWITARGHEAKALLGRRIILPPEGATRVELSGPAETVMKTLVRTQCGESAESVRRFMAFSIVADAAKGTQYRLSCAYSSLLMELCACANATGLGFCLNLDSSERMLYFDIIEGMDRSAEQHVNPRAFFATEYDTMRTAELVHGTTGHISTLYVLGAKTSGQRPMAAVWLDTEPAGFERIERALDTPALATIEELSAYGRTRLGTFSRTFSLEADISTESPLTLEKDYDLGDLCSVHANGEWFTVPITSIEQRWSKKGNGIRLGFGKPIQGAFRTAINAAHELMDIVRAS